MKQWEVMGEVEDRLGAGVEAWLVVLEGTFVGEKLGLAGELVSKWAATGREARGSRHLGKE